MSNDPDTRCCCPDYHVAVELIGRRWTGAIVAVLLADSPRRFSELRASVPGLSDRVLSQRMRELEGEDVVVRTVHPGPPLRVEYTLTPKGHDLEPVVRALESWGRRWMCATDGDPAEDAVAGPPCGANDEAITTDTSPAAAVRGADPSARDAALG